MTMFNGTKMPESNAAGGALAYDQMSQRLYIFDSGEWRTLQVSVCCDGFVLYRYYQIFL